MNGYVTTLKRMASISISAVVVALCAALPARAATPPAIAYRQFDIHYTFDHSVTNARLAIYGVSPAAGGGETFSGSLGTGPSLNSWTPVTGSLSPSGASGWSIAFRTGNVIYHTDFAGAVEAEGAFLFMTGTRSWTGLAFSPAGIYFTNSGVHPFCATAYPPIY